MPCKSLCAAMALVALAAPAPAQDRSGINLDAAGTGTPGGVATLALAQDLYDFGITRNDALSVLTAIRLARSVKVQQTPDRTRDTTGTRTAGQDEGAAAPRDLTAPDAITVVKDLAGEDEVLIGLIEAVKANGTASQAGGATATLSRLPAGMTDTWQIAFFGSSYAEIAVLGDGDTNLDVRVTDENGNTICSDASGSDRTYCDFVPAWNGFFFVSVENTGTRRNSYWLMTN